MIAGMTRIKTVHACTDCGTAHPKWTGQCSGCGAWNTLVEEVPADAPAGRRARRWRWPSSACSHDIDALLAEPAADGHRRARPGARRRHRARVGHAARRRAGHRQEHAAAAAAGVVAGPDALRQRRGERPAGAPAGRAARRRAARRCGWPPRRRWPASSTPSTARRPSLVVVDSIQTIADQRLDVVARLGRPGARVRPAARRRGQAARRRRSCSSATSPRTARSPGRACSSTSSTPCCRSRASATTPCACCGPSSTASARPTSSACSR